MNLLPYQLTISILKRVILKSKQTLDSFFTINTRVRMKSSLLFFSSGRGKKAF